MKMWRNYFSFTGVTMFLFIVCGLSITIPPFFYVCMGIGFFLSLYGVIKFRRNCAYYRHELENAKNQSEP
jgi:hypothetical protein